MEDNVVIFLPRCTTNPSSAAPVSIVSLGGVGLLSCVPDGDLETIGKSKTN